MANMSHCRMENTFRDLKDCYENWDQVESDSEKKYQKLLLNIARELVTDFGMSDEEEEDSPPETKPSFPEMVADILDLKG